MQHSAQRTILIVEDDVDDRVMLRRFLGRETGFRVIEAASGADGLATGAVERPDCVLLDYFLPDMTGAEFIQALRDANDGVLPFAVAVLTGQEDGDVATEVLAHGAQDYLVKGTITEAGLSRAVENVIGRYQIYQELEEKRTALELRNVQLEALRDELQARLVELAEATHAKEQFLAVMSHEMRTPLNAILGYADLLEMGIGGPLAPGQRQHVDRIRVGGRHLLDLINDVLDVARADARKLEVDLRPIDLGAVLEEVAALLESQAGGKRIGLRVETCDGPIPHVMGDLRRLRQILTNLVGNAIKFTDRGSVVLRCRAADRGRVAIDVTDTGIGIADDVLPLIFTEFYQARGELTRVKGGSGLGLAISQRLARLMKGDVTVRSEAGVGSIFTLSLPAAEAGSLLRDEDVESHEVRMKAHQVPTATVESPTSASVVAFGEDPLALSELAERVLPNVQLSWTTRADEVLELARRQSASLVVLDITCAEGAGWRIAHAIPETPELAGTAVLLLPRLPNAESSETGTGFDLGWVSLMPKPYTQEQLSHAVTRAAQNAPDVEAQPGAAAPLEVLIVDDDLDSRRVAANILKTSHVVVRQAADGESALISMRRRRPDVIVLDLMMPVLDGFGVLAAMRADPRLASLPVVVLSAKSLSEPERRFLARTAVRVLEKGEHRLADVAALVLRAAAQAARGAAPTPPPE